MSSSFDDILYRADTLLSRVRLPSQQGKAQRRDANQCFHPSLDDIFRQSETLWKRKRPLDQGRAELQANLLLGEKGFSLSGVQESFMEDVSSREGVQAQTEESIESMQQSQPTAACDPDKINLEAERTFLNQYTVDNMPPSCVKQSMQINADIPQLTTAHNANAVQLAFYNALSKYVVVKSEEGLANDMLKAASNSGDENIKALWEVGLTLLSSSLPDDHYETARARRSSPEFTKRLVHASTRYLQHNFLAYAKDLVRQHIGTASTNLSEIKDVVDGYLRAQRFHPLKRPIQDGLCGVDRHPVWEVLYHYLRVGHYSELVELVRCHIDKLPSCVALANALSTIGTSNKLSAQQLEKVRLEWRAEGSSMHDVYKKAVYVAVVGGADVPEICDSLESWLWLKLFPYSLDPNLSSASLAKLQKLISCQYGEDYFGLESNLFFEALWLSGQFERAICALYRSGDVIHAVHLAILADVKGLLVTSASEASTLLVKNEKDALDCSLNLCRLLLTYVKLFECTDVRKALDYYFILRRFNLPTGGNLFNACVSRAVYLSGDTSEVLGRIGEDGTRYNGCIDKFVPHIDVHTVIVKVAADCELSHNPIQAVQLYHVAQREDDATRVMIECMADALVDHKERDEPHRMAVWLAGLYKENKSKLTHNRYHLLCVLIDVSTLFRCFSNKRYSSCMEIIKRLKCLPESAADVSVFVSMFDLIPVQMRSLLPELCVCVLHVVCSQLNESSMDKKDAVQWADAIVAYAARVPLHFPNSLNTQILEFNSRIHAHTVPIK